MFQALAKLQDAMRANVEDFQQKNRVLRKALTTKERQLSLAQRTIERLSNERTMIQVFAAQAVHSQDPAACFEYSQESQALRDDLHGWQAVSEADKARIQKLDAALSAMRSISGSQMLCKQHRIKVPDLGSTRNQHSLPHG
jgi:hypothetical protein